LDDYLVKFRDAKLMQLDVKNRHLPKPMTVFTY